MEYVTEILCEKYKRKEIIRFKKEKRKSNKSINSPSNNLSINRNLPKTN